MVGFAWKLFFATFRQAGFVSRGFCPSGSLSAREVLLNNEMVFRCSLFFLMGRVVGVLFFRE